MKDFYNENKDIAETITTGMNHYMNKNYSEALDYFQGAEIKLENRCSDLENKITEIRKKGENENSADTLQKKVDQYKECLKYNKQLTAYAKIKEHMSRDEKSIEFWIK